MPVQVGDRPLLGSKSGTMPCIQGPWLHSATHRRLGGGGVEGEYTRISRRGPGQQHTASQAGRDPGSSGLTDIAYRELRNVVEGVEETHGQRLRERKR